jgi:hypothetical protein
LSILGWNTGRCLLGDMPQSNEDESWWRLQLLLAFAVNSHRLILDQAPTHVKTHKLWQTCIYTILVYIYIYNHHHHVTSRWTHFISHLHVRRPIYSTHACNVCPKLSPANCLQRLHCVNQAHNSLTITYIGVIFSYKSVS